MPETYRPPGDALLVLLSHHHRYGFLVRARCRCSTRFYYPGDLARLFGDIPVLHLYRHMRDCAECGRRDSIKVGFELPSAMDRDKIKVRKLVEVRLRKVPLWTDE